MNDTEYKTIRQIADEIGVTKQAIFYRIKKPPLSNALQSLTTKLDGVLMVSFDGEMLIKREFSDNDRQTFDDKKQPFDDKEPSKENTSFDGEIIKILQENISVLHKQLDVKDKQLEVKDKQIEELTATIRIQAESINAAHHNELAETIIDSQATTAQLTTENNKKKNLWNRLFKRK
jgi:predicted transcriptional regulator